MTNNSMAVVKEIIADQFAFPEDELSEKTHLYNEIGVDSAALFELMIRLEDAVKVKIKSFEKIETVGDIFNLVSVKLGEK